MAQRLRRCCYLVLGGQLWRQLEGLSLDLAWLGLVIAVLSTVAIIIFGVARNNLNLWNEWRRLLVLWRPVLCARKSDRYC